jgi:ferrochelatase
MTTNKTGVVLLNMGGPDSLDDIEPYLRNIFSDAAILDMPLGFLLRPFLAPAIARRRAPKSAERYRLIGGKTPLNEIARQQALALQKELSRRNIDAVVRPGMRYWHPFTEMAVEEFIASGIDRIVGLSMYPQYCRATSGSSIADFERHAKRLLPKAKRSIINSWNTLPAYTNLMAARVDAAVNKMPPEERKSCCVLFSAHSVPRKLVDRGDPYQEQVIESYEAIKAQMQTEPRMKLAFQSAIGPVKWLEPDSVTATKGLAEEGFRTLVAVPLGFVAENIETLWDIEIDLFEHAREFGFTTCERIECPNDHPAFIAGLADLVESALKESA